VQAAFYVRRLSYLKIVQAAFYVRRLSYIKDSASLPFKACFFYVNSAALSCRCDIIFAVKNVNKYV